LKRVRWESPEALAPGKHTLEFAFKYDGLGVATLAFNNMNGIGQSGTGVLKVDGKDVATQKMEHTVPLILQWDETFDVGADTGTPLDVKDYQSPFKFTGTLAKLTLKVDRPECHWSRCGTQRPVARRRRPALSESSPARNAGPQVLEQQRRDALR
jgi:arylsulfatase